MTSEHSQSSKSQRGRPRGEHGPKDISSHLKIVRDLFPHLPAAHTFDGLCRAMGEYLEATPQSPNVVAVISGRKPLTEKFLRALHCAFELHKLGLPAKVWLESPDRFKMMLDTCFLSDPVVALRSIASPTAWASFIKGHLVLGAGSPSNANPAVNVGNHIQIRFHLPRPGFLTVFNADPYVGGARYYWLNPGLDSVKQKLAAGITVLPKDEPYITIGPPANVTSTLIAINTVRNLDMMRPIPTGDRVCPEIEVSSVRRLTVQVLALQDFERSVAIYDYDVLMPAASIATEDPG